MPRQRLGRPKVAVHIYVDEELFYYFKYFFLSPTEGRMKQGFSTLVETLLRHERDRMISIHGAPTPLQETS